MEVERHGWFGTLMMEMEMEMWFPKWKGWLLTFTNCPFHYFPWLFVEDACLLLFFNFQYHFYNFLPISTFLLKKPSTCVDCTYSILPFVPSPLKKGEKNVSEFGFVLQNKMNFICIN